MATGGHAHTCPACRSDVWHAGQMLCAPPRWTVPTIATQPRLPNFAAPQGTDHSQYSFTRHMGLFSNLFGGGQQKSASFNKQEAFVGFLLAVIAADGVITQEEILDFYSATNKAQVMQGVGQNDFKRIIDKVMGVLKKQGMGEMLNLAALGTTPDMKNGIFAYCCDLVFSDSNVDPSEAKMMDHIKGLLQVDDAFAEKAGRIARAKSSV